MFSNLEFHLGVGWPWGEEGAQAQVGDGQESDSGSLGAVYPGGMMGIPLKFT